jgi:protein gp37
MAIFYFQGIKSMVEEGIKERTAIDWVITGGESGPKARPCHPDWIRSLRDQCDRFGIPFFFKQWGEFSPNCNDPKDNKARHGEIMCRVGKAKAGHELDGITHLNFPWEAFSIRSTIKF